MAETCTYFFVFPLLFSLLEASITLDTLPSSQSIRDGDRLVSAGGTFEMGFFSPGSSKSRYVGIWYAISSGIVVWVANRDTPLNDHSGVLTVTDEGVLALHNSTNNVVWSTNTSRTAENPVAQLLDTGNLVVKDGNVDDPERFLWQSFDYPCDTFLPGMKLGRNLVTGLDRFLSSWKNEEDPARGEFSVRLDPRGLPQMVVKKGNTIMARAGSWNGLRYTGSPNLNPNLVFVYEFVMNQNEVYFEFKLVNPSVFLRYIIKPSGVGQRLMWLNRTSSWEPFTTTQADACQRYAFCGAYAACDTDNSPACACLEGFLPKSPKDWKSVDWSDGCARRTPLVCNIGSGFRKYTGLKLPDTSSSWFNATLSLDECQGLCLRNCSCTAYSNLDIRGKGSGCVLWFGKLSDIALYSQGGQELYIKMASSELENNGKKGNTSKIKRAGIIAGAVALVNGILTLGVISYIRKKKSSFKGMAKRRQEKDCENEGLKEDMELPIIDLTTIANATNNFSTNNKLGEGGFGPVYKVTLPEGQVIAVKRLSMNSGQGHKEFINEVKLIAKLQHRNLVKLLGCCTEENEKILIYEYMPNKSLDSFIFDQAKRKLLDWRKRIDIIGGIAKGLLYLHEDSRLRVIHRDLKASNILLDMKMNPKISDFGLARSFRGDQIVSRTHRIVGTYGYMSPEYAVHGQYSVKSDVFSFGVLVLEILSGKKNRGFCHPDDHLNLLGHAWRLWIVDRAMELIDESVGDAHTRSEVLRLIQVGLLCVQQRPEDRPNMSSVVLMLSSEILLPIPRQPGFYADSPSSNNATYSANGISISTFEAR
ncbi:G-type lectin S-receptor-like serine/threonine-protein kinase At4g27290 isoform X1 [Juglans microcarpa x Juglans regia]|uniref:G-type lectin S-receptor-like serine/threonine-protein kinase At4g27290 isoform X1 n=2 Tax=Juglans microcarpa x Juglans regia TaxID=2249226 RepID=UPI001B7E9AA2|nr:G-type lectin S-receptor-like serine/threonine-protein kinase At4g27290 isoform X1 [Juglans microcarpa x Juglans regia]